uniref:Secreted protein n=1 Tax=Oryza glumipatula TaxID=40148 RepID=A0A0D9YP89_9ORYZ
MARLRRLRLLAIVQLAVAIWLAATSCYQCKLDAVPPPPPTELVDGGRGCALKLGERAVRLSSDGWVGTAPDLAELSSSLTLTPPVMTMTSTPIADGATTIDICWCYFISVC